MKPTPALDVPPRAKHSIYPEPFASRMKNRTKRQLGDFFHLSKFGVNYTELHPGGESALFHEHTKQEEFIFILEGSPTIRIGAEEFELAPGMCMGLRPGGGAHQLLNRTDRKVAYLEIGDRETGDTASYPEDDLVAEMGPDKKWIFTHKDGRPYVASP